MSDKWFDACGGQTTEQLLALELAEDAAVHEALDSCDTGYYDNDEPIADRLFAWIRKNEALVRVGGA